MTVSFIRSALQSLLAVATVCVAAPVSAETFPSREVKIIVPYTAGSPPDILARALGDRLSAIWKQPVVIDNRTGAAGIVAAEATVRSQPDGYTILLDGQASFTSNMYLYSNLPYDTGKDLLPVTRLTDVFLGLVVANNIPASSLKDFVQLLKNNPGKYTYGSAGPGTAPNVVVEAFKKKHGIQITHVPYKGSAEAYKDIVGQRLTALYTNPSVVKGQIESGDMKLLGFSGPARIAMFPTVPTLTEGGFPDLDVGSFYALAVAAGTPSDIVHKIAADAAQVVQKDQEFQTKLLLSSGYVPVGDTPEQFAEFLKGARARMANMVKSTGIKMD
ncbi:tripartite tricarboxylate transporter substrate binding protein [Aminobacter sp. MSH1]|uniref:Bug family tripartite tricarboxylate transporter substrate binding protein n=1 Tax=Aminobacter sp. MSH1 TaxID=374606 RepID=UPI000D3D8C53|nr:tripartite tricarboxylate transporter substrate binding protein [Aminobacter sp. MSH1]